MNKYIKQLITLATLILSFLQVTAQEAKTGSISGTILSKESGEPIAYAQVILKGTTIGSTSDADGNFTLKGLPTGSQTIVARSVGYSSSEQRVHVVADRSQHLDFFLAEESIALEGVVVSANRSETLRRLAPSLVTVLAPELFLKTNSSNLSQGLRFQPGLRIEDNCQNCGFNQVRINGLEGAYSQILIDSQPIFGALAGVYGLEQIPANMIERVEVIRGGGSALFGSNAVGGVINVITREPLNNSAEISHSSIGISNEKGKLSSMQNVSSIQASVLSQDRKAGISAFGQHNYRPGHDFDGDAYSELPKLHNRSLGFRSFYKPSLFSKLNAEYHSRHEYRRGGDRLDLPPFQARIAEYLEHYVNGGSLKYDLWSDAKRNNLSLYSSAQHVKRKSYYGGGDGSTNGGGDDALKAYGDSKSLDLHMGTMYRHSLGELFDLSSGIEYNHSSLVDKSGYRIDEINQVNNTLSHFDQLEYKTDKWSLLGGFRIDHARLSQAGKNDIKPLWVFSPRLNLRYNPIRDLSMRLSYSEGFRSPQYFDEELHVELAGGKPIVRILDKNLREERSRSLSGSIDWYGRSDKWQYNAMIEGFLTFISNQFVVGSEEQVDDKTIRRIINNKGPAAKVFGISAEARLAYDKLWDLQLGATLQKSMHGKPIVRVDADEATGQKELSTKTYERTPNFYGYFISTLRPTHDFAITLSGTLTGRMKVLHEAYEGEIDQNQIGSDGSFDYIHNGVHYKGLAEGFARYETSPVFADLDLKLSYNFHLSSTIDLELNAGAQNFLNSYQRDTDKGPGRASAYVYGPMQPRRIFIGTKLNF